MDQIVQTVGALLILVAFVAAQRGRLTTNAPAYLWLNLAGGLVLAVTAVIDTQIGFIILETVWALVAAHGLLSRGRAAHSG